MAHQYIYHCDFQLDSKVFGYRDQSTYEARRRALYRFDPSYDSTNNKKEEQATSTFSCPEDCDIEHFCLQLTINADLADEDYVKVTQVDAITKKEIAVWEIKDGVGRPCK